MLALLRHATEAALSLFYPPHCANCGEDTPKDVFVCPKCAEQAKRIEPPCCRQCSQPFEGAITGEFTCGDCHGRGFHFDCAVASFRAKGIVREFIHRFKYQRERFLRHPLAEWAALGLSDPRITSQPFDAFVPVPLHPTKLREREFNQAESIAQILSARARKPVVIALERVRYTTSQTRFQRSDRMENLHGAFRVRQPDGLLNRHLILVDDVFTTGSTVEECARVLRQASAASVRALTVARA
jgi:competence protein ComFC